MSDSVTAQQVFTSMLAEHVAPLLKERGYRRQRHRWGKRVELGWAVLEAQSSWTSTRERVSFTFNLGFRSDHMCTLRGDTFSPRKMSPTSDCHWSERIGTLMPDPRDRWWEVDTNTSAAIVGASVHDAVRAYGLPMLERVAANARAWLHVRRVSHDPVDSLIERAARMHVGSDAKAFAAWCQQQQAKVTEAEWAVVAHVLASMAAACGTN